MDISANLRYAGRMLRLNPGFAAVAIITLALGIGATTAMFSVVDGVLLKSLRYPDAERIVAINTRWADSGSAVLPYRRFSWMLQPSVFHLLVIPTPSLRGGGICFPLPGEILCPRTAGANILQA
ncbi:MAG TPA: hypothetical protein VJ723_03545 [Candidatus Angelobacter sp.]|nr:hypothetical protein [Candidatus Angelobacter sp.]